MNFDTPPQALTICGEWNKILKIPGTSGRLRRTACLPARTLRGLGGAARRAGNVPAEG